MDKDEFKKWLEHLNELPELQCALCGVVFKGSHECDYKMLKEKVERLENELTGYKLSNQSLSHALDKEIKDNLKQNPFYKESDKELLKVKIDGHLKSEEDELENWNYMLEQAKEYGLWFDKEIVADMIKTIEEQQKEIEQLKDNRDFWKMKYQDLKTLHLYGH